MDPFDYLLTFAEIGVALAGFAALMVVLRDRSDVEFSTLDRAIVALLVERSLIATFFSLYPGILRGLDLSHSVIASISSAVWIIYSSHSALRTTKLQRGESSINHYISLRTRSILWVVFLAVSGIQIANVFGWGIGPNVWWYVLAILWILVSAGWLFFFFVRSWMRAT